MRRRASAMTLPAVAALAAATRLTALDLTRDYLPAHDDNDYVRVARSLAEQGRYPGRVVPGIGWEPSAYRPPAWPLVLAATGPSVPTGRAVLVVLGIALAVLAAVIARQLWGEREALVAGGLVALSPLLVALGTSLMSETLFAVLVLGAVAAALAAREQPHPGRWALCGALVGLAALTRTNGLALIPLLAWLAVPPGAGRRGWRAAAVVAVAAVAAVAPWTIRNAVELHAFVPVSTETGNTLAGTYNPAARAKQGAWVGPKKAHAYLWVLHPDRGDVATDAGLRHEALTYARRHPAYVGEVLAFNGARLLGFWAPVWAGGSLGAIGLFPSALTVGAVFVVTALVSLLALLGGLLAPRRRAPVALWAVAAGLWLPVAIANGELRLGAPLHALLAVLAAPAVVALAARARVGA